MVSGEIEIPAGDARIPAYCARPAVGKAFLVVIVLHEIYGVDEHIREICSRFAEAGYLAIAPYLFFRQGNVDMIPDTRQIVSKIVSKVPDAQVITDLDAIVRWAKTEHDIGRLAVAGFSWGGRIVWLYAAHSKQLKAGAAWYGKLAGNKSPAPLDIASSLKAPVIGFYGAKDADIPSDTVERMKAALKPPSQIVVYPSAGHGFNGAGRESYNEQAALDSWRRMLEFFGEHLQ